MSHYKSFLLSKSINTHLEDSISSQLFEGFSIYLTEFKRTRISSAANDPDSPEENYSLGTVHQYISGVFNVLKQNNPQLPLWQHDLVPTGTKGEFVPRWYRTIRENIARRICNRVIQNGEKIQTKSEPIGRNLLTQMTLALMNRNNLDAVEMATTFVWDFSSCGRYSMLYYYVSYVYQQNR